MDRKAAKDPRFVAAGRAGAYIAHSRHSGLAMTAVARAKREQQFVDQARAEAVARGEQLSEQEVLRRGDMLRKAELARMNLASVLKRARKKRAADEVESSAAKQEVASASGAPAQTS